MSHVYKPGMTRTERVAMYAAAHKLAWNAYDKRHAALRAMPYAVRKPYAKALETAFDKRLETLEAQARANHAIHSGVIY